MSLNKIKDSWILEKRNFQDHSIKSIKKEQQNQVQSIEKQYLKDSSNYKFKKEAQNRASVDLRVFGISNIGNTCFFNSVLQCLYSSEILHLAYRTSGFTEDINLMLKKFLLNQQKTFNPKSLFSLLIKSKGMYKHMNQQDAQQLLSTLLNMAMDGQKKQGKDRAIGIKQLFGFELTNRLYCFGCKRTSWSRQFNLDLNVQLGNKQKIRIKVEDEEQLKQLEIKGINKKQIGEQGWQYPRIEKEKNNVLDNFFSDQILTKRNSFQCEHCEFQKASKRFFFRTVPLNLIIALKRFNKDGTKNNSAVRIDEFINISSKVLIKKDKFEQNEGEQSDDQNDVQNMEYELYAASVHGGTTGGGHYVAYTKRMNEKGENQWYYFSDSAVKPANWNKVQSSSPYILFYKKMDHRQNNEKRKQNKKQ